MYKTASSVLNIEVWFIVTTSRQEKVRFLFLGDVSNHVDPQVSIPPGTHIVTMHLRTAVDPESLEIDALRNAQVTDPSLRAHFTTAPLQWVTEAGIPKQTPGTYSVSRIDGSKINIFACNASNDHEVPEIYPVRLLAMYQGDIFWTPDPTMINLPKNP